MLDTKVNKLEKGFKKVVPKPDGAKKPSKVLTMRLMVMSTLKKKTMLTSQWHQKAA